MKNYSQKEMIFLLERCNLDFLDQRLSERMELGEERQWFRKNPVKFIGGFYYNKIRYHKFVPNSGVNLEMKRSCWNEAVWKKALVREDDSKIVVYSCVTGNYDKIKEPHFNCNKNVDYVMYTDADIESKIWEIRKIPESLSNYSSAEVNRYIKMHPAEFFPEYDYSIYIDGNITVISDMAGLTNLINDKYGIAMHEHAARKCIYDEVMVCGYLNKGNYSNLKKQTEEYRTQGFPEKYGLLECPVIACDLKNETAKDIFEQWWEEFMKSKSRRDQIALPYVLWKNRIKPAELGTLGKNVYRNPKLRVDGH